MAGKPTYEELEQKVRECEEEAVHRKKAQQALRASEAKLVENLKRSYLFYSHGSDGTLTYVSPNIADVLGYTQKEFASNFREYLTDNPVNREYLDSTGGSAYSQYFHEIEIFHKNGDSHWLEITAVPVFDTFGNVVSCDEIVQDVTRRKKAEIEREELISDLKKALAEIKTLRGIVPICSFCKQIRDDEGFWNKVESYVSKHTHARFSHSVCPECARKHYPEMFEDDQ